ncbi:MAG: D-alanyl-D-alanine carboxypeptidase/D-alanyl-D-alanine-endopeptidase [Actinobacteria bacterium]|nr:MAG: D-alanyl-D-alanine carboxypeptidase/D-alanyl-D-alanine-endopeptidase [Actinomycetota bacterium]
MAAQYSPELGPRYGPRAPSSISERPKFFGHNLPVLLGRRLAALGGFVALLAPAAAQATAPSSAGQLAHALRGPGIAPGESTAMAIDLATGETIFARNANVALEPASNEKLTVTYGALVELGPDYRFRTALLGEGKQVGDVWQGRLVLKGYGDPTLSSADLASLARQVRADGITSVSGRVLGDESWFDLHRTAPGWKAAFYIHESPPLSALIVDRALVARSTSHDPALAAAQLFTRALVRAGVRVAGAASLGVADDAAVGLGSVDSPPLEEIVHWMDQVSDNFTAEMLTKELGAVQAGKGTTAAGLTVVGDQLAAAGVPLAGVRMVDGSGLSRLDRLTPTMLVALLRVMWADPGVQPELVSSLPLAGRTGTLHNRMRGTPAAGVVRAKTGTTDDSTALSGFVGDRYAFSVIVNGAPVSWTWSRIAEDSFATTLASSR